MNLIITNRELLRRYKELKNKLVNGEVDEVAVPQKDGMIIKIRIEKKKTPMQELLEMVEKKPLKGIKRPEEDLF
ncbi:hypothetical protein HY604_04015 [Candidatus Peregrinibacteria bacterium]|nr:hypothetical protein [Candidatus Peregrinibacteria bacterium]